jgi:hypothetical protein
MKPHIGVKNDALARSAAVTTGPRMINDNIHCYTPQKPLRPSSA